MTQSAARMRLKRSCSEPHPALRLTVGFGELVLQRPTAGRVMPATHSCCDGLQHGQRRLGLVEHVEVDARHTLLDQLADLPRGELHTHLVLPVRVVVGGQLGRQTRAAAWRRTWTRSAGSATGC